MIFTSQVLVIEVCATPPIKLKLGTANEQMRVGAGGSTNSKPPGRIIIMVGQSEILCRSQIIFVIGVSAGALAGLLLLRNFVGNFVDKKKTIFRS
jgi:hypothetical protein